MKQLLSSKLGKAGSAAFLLLLVFWVVLRFTRAPVWPLLDPILLALILTAVLWVALDLGYRAWQKRRQANFDAKLAAREGIDDRKREWAEWTAELRRQGIDRYQLPMYLLLGEPQSGKSVMLRHSDLHFPFGQSRLSGVGGTKGCDWWFTDQAVILDLAGRLFTHEGGASDEAEWAAFLELLAAFRPQCPANGVILVLPCDGLASDDEAVISRKATKMQGALTTLTDRLQARLPVYVVLTKADKVFGFAECVHRLDAPKRHEMFGWSRPLERLEAPFDAAESQRGFEGLVERARLLRSQMLATARIPEALSEVDRFYAFPDELAALWPSLALYLQRVFTESRLIDKLFFRGLYLTSGLQSGAPIAKVCAELMGRTGEADRRNLEGLFTKQRAYFIKDLVRERIFTEQGLVRPTRRRVVRARRNARIAYGAAGVGALLSLYWTSVVVAKETNDETRKAVRETVGHMNEGEAQQDPYAVLQALAGLDQVIEEIGPTPYVTVKDDLEGLRERALEWTAPGLAADAARAFVARAEPTSFADFEGQMSVARLLLAARLDEVGWKRLLAFLGETQRKSFPVTTSGADTLLHLPAAERNSVLARAKDLWEGRLQAGSGWVRPSRLGVVLACRELIGPGQSLRLATRVDGCEAIRRCTHALDLLASSQPLLEGARASIARTAIAQDLQQLSQERADFFVAIGEDRADWVALTELRNQLAAGEPFPVPKPALDLLTNEPLKEVCRPSFLALADLVRLPQDLARTLPPDTLVQEVFQAKLGCAENDYVEAFGDVARLRARLPLGERTSEYSPELSEHLGAMLAALVAFPGSDWSHHVGRLVDEYELALLRTWSADSLDFESELELHLERVMLAASTPGRDAWLRSVAALLAERLGSPLHAAAAGFDRRGNRPGVGEFARPLRSVAAVLARDERMEPEDLSARLVEARALAKAPPRSGAGAFVDLCFRALCEVALQERVRPAFRKDFRAELEGSSRGLVEALWGTSDLAVDLSFFDRGGTLDRLREKYHVRSLEPLGVAQDASAPPPMGWTLAEFRGAAEEPCWEALGFLLELQAFLLKGDPEGKHVTGAKRRITVTCDCASPAFSHSNKKGSFYLHCGEAFDTEFLGDRIPPLSLELTFGSIKDFRLRWADAQPESAADLVIAESGALAPLRLAWRGTRTPENDWLLRETLPRTELEARLTLTFEQALPPRPAPPFASE